jgi:hypothetical protein
VDSDSENESDEQASPDRTADRLTKDDAEADESEEEDADEDQENIDEEALKQFIAPGSSDFPRNYQAALQRLTTVPLQHLWRLSICTDTCLIRKRFLVAYAKQINSINVPLKSVVRHFRDQWLFGDPNQLPFREDTDLDPNAISRRAHLPEDWMQLADIALCLISISTSEADCEGTSQSSATPLERRQRSTKTHHSQFACAFASQLDHKGLHDRKNQSMLQCLRGPNMLVMSLISNRIIIIRVRNSHQTLHNQANKSNSRHVTYVPITPRSQDRRCSAEQSANLMTGA